MNSQAKYPKLHEINDLPKHIKKPKTYWIQLGFVGVDSGMLMIGDPCYLEGDNWGSEDYDRLIDMDLCKQIVSGTNAFKAVVFESGLGDGVYQVTAKVKEYAKLGRRIKEVRIKLI